MASIVCWRFVGGLEHRRATSGGQDPQRLLSSRRAYAAIGTLLFLVIVPLAANTVVTYAVAVWSDRVQETAGQWIAAVPGAEVETVNPASGTFYVHVKTPRAIPPVGDLITRLRGKVPDSLAVVVSRVVGSDTNQAVVGR